MDRRRCFLNDILMKCTVFCRMRFSLQYRLAEHKLVLTVDGPNAVANVSADWSQMIRKGREQAVPPMIASEANHRWCLLFIFEKSNQSLSIIVTGINALSMLAPVAPNNRTLNVSLLSTAASSTMVILTSFVVSPAAKVSTLNVP